MPAARDTADDIVRLGQITAPHGIKGWVKVRSDTEPRNAILQYQPWLVGPERTEMRIVDSAAHSRRVLAALDGVDDRSAAEALAGQEIAVRRRQLPELPPDSFYWADLVGATVATRDGVELGVVSELMETGANDVMLVRGERDRLIPFVMGQYICSVDLDSNRIEVDWDPDF